MLTTSLSWYWEATSSSSTGWAWWRHTSHALPSSGDVLVIFHPVLVDTLLWFQPMWGLVGFQSQIGCCCSWLRKTELVIEYCRRHRLESLSVSGMSYQNCSLRFLHLYWSFFVHIDMVLHQLELILNQAWLKWFGTVRVPTLLVQNVATLSIK